ncbi:MAG: hypothetical protein U9Q33_03725 [Campylobacterota bacterium]|nr:hypothetical protein [Campylobacterota bacterium]
MKKLVVMLLLSSALFSSEYYAKLQPVQVYNVKSSVNGKIVDVNSSSEAKNVSNAVIVRIDSKVNQIDLKQSNIKLKSLNAVLEIEKGVLESFKKISSKSKFDKDNQKIKILNIESSISDLTTKIETLKDTIKKKILEEKDKYIYNIAVEVGDYVNPGSVLYTAMNTSKGKLEIFIPVKDAQTIKEKTIYLDGVKTDLKINKLYTVADSKHLSSYKCEIVVPSPKRFSRLVKIEFK